MVFACQILTVMPVCESGYDRDKEVFLSHTLLLIIMKNLNAQLNALENKLTKKVSYGNGVGESILKNPRQFVIRKKRLKSGKNRKD
jgi:hypothetical protein